MDQNLFPNRLSYAIPMPYIPSTTSSSSGTTTTSTTGPLPPPPSIPTVTSVPETSLSSTSPSSPTKVQSNAVVKYAEVAVPVPLNKIARNTDLRQPPENWLRNERGTKGFVASHAIQSGFSSFKLANDFVDSMPDVDVISDAENIKKLLKLPYSNSALSMVVHRIGKTLLIDDFDIHQYLLRRSATEWEWLSNYFRQTILEEVTNKEGLIVRKNNSSALQDRNLVSKFLYRSLQHHADDAEGRDSLQDDVDHETKGVEATPHQEVPEHFSEKFGALNLIPPLPEPELEKAIPFLNETKGAEGFARNFIWNFEDIRMLIGSNLPIFGDEDHPCVSLRLRDMKKPINVLTGLDYWLDNLMCQVPEVVMCYHLDGIVQQYELIKTEDLPSMEGSRFAPKIVKNIAQNILSFLKSKAAKEGHTYWLFKAKNDDVVKLYDLTSLSQKDSGIQPKDGNLEDDLQQPPSAAGSSTSGSNHTNNGDGSNPFQTPVSLLLYRLARNILDARDDEGPGEHSNKNEDCAVARALLKNCIELIDESKYPHIATSAHFLLSELYLPADTDPTKPAFSKPPPPAEPFRAGSAGHYNAGGRSGHGSPVKKASIEEEDNDELEEDEFSVDVHTLCHPGSFTGFRDRLSGPAPPPISDDVEFRCSEALQHINQGLQYISKHEARRKAMEEAYRKEQEKLERENMKMSVPGQAIPMGYIPSDTKIVKRTRSFSLGHEAQGKIAPVYKRLSSSDYLKFILLKKATLVYITLAEINFDLERFGRSLRCVKRALNCYSMVESMGGYIEAETSGGLIAFALGVAGDCYLAFISRWSNLPLFQEQYQSIEAGEGGIAQEIERYTQEEDRDWIIKLPRDIEEGLNLSAKCYSKALDHKNISREDEISLTRRLGNVNNELSVFVMNKTTEMLQELASAEESQETEEPSNKNTDEKEMGEKEEELKMRKTGIIAAANELLKNSRQYLEKGIRLFESISDSANIALLHSNSGRLSRISGHILSITREAATTHEFGSGELNQYKNAISEYQLARAILSSRRTNPGVWDSVTWELCSTYFTVGTLLQDEAPLSCMTREEAEKQVIEYFTKSLKYCDLEMSGPRQVVYQYRAAVIHQRLASLYHSSYRSFDIEDNSFRKKKLRQLSENHYGKAEPLYLQLERSEDFIRCVLERCGLYEANLEGASHGGAKHKIYLQVLEGFIDILPVLQKLEVKPGGDEKDSGLECTKPTASQDQGTAEGSSPPDIDVYLLKTLLQRVQATLLSLYKLLATKQQTSGKKSKESAAADPLAAKFKQLYGESLKASESPEKLAALLRSIQTKEK